MVSLSFPGHDIWLNDASTSTDARIILSGHFAFLALHDSDDELSIKLQSVQSEILSDVMNIH